MDVFQAGFLGWIARIYSYDANTSGTGGITGNLKFSSYLPTYMTFSQDRLQRRFAGVDRTLAPTASRDSSWDSPVAGVDTASDRNRITNRKLGLGDASDSFR